MAVTTPEWLSRHGGELQAKHAAYIVFFDGAPQYRLTLSPAAGKFGCEVMQTINGKRVESGGTYATADYAIRGGLEDLRKILGW